MLKKIVTFQLVVFSRTMMDTTSSAEPNFAGNRLLSIKSNLRLTQSLPICRLHIMWIFYSTTSQRCSVWLRSGECGCRLSTANTSHVQETSEIIWSFWYVVLSYWKEPSEVRYTVLIKRWTWSTVFRQLCKQMLNQKLRVRRPADGLLKRPGNSP